MTTTTTTTTTTKMTTTHGETALPSYLEEESSDDDEKALYSNKDEDNKTSNKSKKRRRDRKNDVSGRGASVWLPSLDSAMRRPESCYREKEEAQRELHQVLDGRQAPVLTGRNRHNAATNKKFKSSSSSQPHNNSTTDDGIDHDGATIAVKFCLQLFYSSLRNNRLNPAEPEAYAL